MKAKKKKFNGTPIDSHYFGGGGDGNNATKEILNNICIKSSAKCKKSKKK